MRIELGNSVKNNFETLVTRVKAKGYEVDVVDRNKLKIHYGGGNERQYIQIKYSSMSPVVYFQNMHVNNTEMLDLIKKLMELPKGIVLYGKEEE